MSVRHLAIAGRRIVRLPGWSPYLQLSTAPGSSPTSPSQGYHSSIQITADIYAGVLPELAAEVAAKVVALVPRKGRRGAAV